MRAAPILLVLLAAVFPTAAPAQTAEPNRPQAMRPAAEAPRAEPPARPRPRDPRDRAFMDGGIPLTPGFSSGSLGAAPASPQAQLAPRPNLDLEARSAAPSQAPSLAPTMIHPRVPGRSGGADAPPTHPDQRLLQTPAPGARLSVPMTW